MGENNKPLLAIDIGNSHTVLGLFSGDTLLESWRLQSDTKRTADEFALQIFALLEGSVRDPGSIARVIISSVVPSLSRVFIRISEKFLKITPVIVDATNCGGIEIDVDNPSSVGADRLVNAIACRDLVGCPAIVVDFGTATTFDVIGENGAYRGGVIAPGVLISADALFQKTAMLPSIDIKRPNAVLGRNTRDSMMAGVYFGYVSLVDGIVERLHEEIGVACPVVATGGLARSIGADSRYIQTVLPDLTLSGLQIIARDREKSTNS